MSATSTCLPKLKLLIVDDHVAFRQMARSRFQNERTQVIECASGLEAVAQFELDQPDWVLMDFEMAPMNGLAATQAILKRYPHARILIVTYRDDSDLREAAREAGARGYILKDNLSQIDQFLSSTNHPVNL